MSAGHSSLTATVASVIGKGPANHWRMLYSRSFRLPQPEGSAENVGAGPLAGRPASLVSLEIRLLSRNEDTPHVV